MTRHDEFAWHRQVSQSRFDNGINDMRNSKLNSKLKKRAARARARNCRDYAYKVGLIFMGTIAALCGGLLAVHDLMTLTGVQTHG